MSSNNQYLTIGELVKKLQKVYPGLTQSKLRFLESKGLISPKRAPNGYRVYHSEDIKVLNYILKMQKDYYMPLEVIKEKIETGQFDKFDKIDESKNVLKELELDKELQLELGKEYRISGPKSLSTEEIKEKYKLSQFMLDELVEDGIISLQEKDGKYVVSSKDAEIIKIVSELSKFGIQIKNLKLFENFATRHSSFIQQIIFPLIKSSSKNSKRRALKALSRLEECLFNFYILLVKRENQKFLDKYK